MFIKKNILENIDKYRVIDNNLFTINFSNEISNKGKTAKLYNTPIDGFIVFNNKVYYNDWEGNYMILGEELELIDSGIGKAFYFSSEKYIGNQYLKNSTIVDALIDNQSNLISIGCIDKFNNLNFSNEYIYIYIGNDKNLNSYLLSEKKNLWHYDLGTKYNYFKEADYQGEPPVEVQAEVIKFLGVYKNELWLVLNSGLLALNIETGTETRYIKEGKMAVGEPFFEDFKGYFGYDTFLDEEKGIIFSLNLHFYIEYDLNSNKNHFDSYSFKASSEKNGLHLNQIGGYDTENIYAYEGSDNNRFAIFSREKKEIIWSEEIPESKDKFPAIRNLQYGAGKIYVLDHYNTLHIFEQENSKTRPF